MSELRLNTDGHIIKFGADNDVSLTHVADTGLLLNSTMQLQFNDASQNINAPSATVLDINATDEIELNATLVDINANVEISGTATTTGVHTFSAAPVFPDGSIAVADLDIDGATDIGAAIVDADLFIIDDGAGGTNRKVTASRLKTYAGGAALSNDGNNRVVTGDGSGGLNGEANLSFNGTTLVVTGAANFNNSGASTIGINTTSTDQNCNINFGDNDSGTIGRITYAHDGNFMIFEGGSTEFLRGNDNGVIATGGETSPDPSSGGLCLNQGAADTKILTLKSSDIAHGITAQAETDTYLSIKKFHATNGGVNIQGFGESSEALNFQGEATANNTTTGTGAQAPIMMFGNKKDSTSVTGMSADDNIFVAGTGQSVVRFLVKGDGDIYYDGADQGAYDTYEDAHLARALDLSRNKNLAGVINSKFDDYIKYNHETLASAGLVGREEDGTPNHFINVCGMQRLHNGAIWQQYEKHNQLLEAVYDLAKEAVGEDKANAILDKHEVKRLN